MKNNPIAYEWYNIETGHCYVDYIRHPDLEFDGEYTKTPLYKTEQSSAPVSGEIIKSNIIKLINSCSAYKVVSGDRTVSTFDSDDAVEMICAYIASQFRNQPVQDSQVTD